MISLVLCFVLILLFLKFLKRRREKYEVFSRFPGPPTSPIFGNILQFGTTKTKIWENLLRIDRQYGPIYKLWFGPACVNLVVSGPEYIEKILITKAITDKGLFFKFAEDWLGDSFLISSGEKWHSRRKNIAPFFNIINIEKFVPVFNANANKLIKVLKTLDFNKSVQINDHLASYGLDNVCQTMIDSTCDEQSKLKIWKNINIQLDIIFRRTFSTFKRFDVMFKRTKDYHTQKKSVLEAISVVSSFVLTKKKKLQNNLPPDKATLLDILLERCNSKPEYRIKDIYNDLDALVFAGTETISSTLGFCLYQLSKHQDVQSKLEKEMESIFGDSDCSDVTVEGIHKMKYLDCVLKETLRLFTPFPLTERTIAEDITIDGKCIPKGTSILIPLIGAHRNQKFYPDPEKFDPDRFLPGNCDHINTCAFIPFGAGPRKCIGWKFAMVEAKVILSKIIKSFQIFPVEGHQVILGLEIRLTSVNGLPIILKPKNFHVK